MSVLIASQNAFERIYDKSLSYTFRNTVDINYCNALGRFTERKIKQIVKTWADLNEESYNIRYKEEPGKIKYSEFLNLRFAGERINSFQMLKSLQMIEYNIEDNEIKLTRELTPAEIEAMAVLRAAISEISNIIIDTIPAYQEAKYCL